MEQTNQGVQSNAGAAGARADESTTTSGASVRVYRTAREIEPIAQALEQLARAAIEPNVFYEPWMLLPALRAFTRDEDLRIAVVERANGTPIGLFPLVREPHYRGLPLPVLRPWRHEYCMLATPLVHAAFVSECMNGFLDWLRVGAGAIAVEFDHVTGDGAFAHALIDALDARGEPHCSVSRTTRGFFRPRIDADAYLAAAMSHESRRKLRQREKALREAGSWAFVEMGPHDDVGAWTAEFLRVEASGWKGEANTAMSARHTDRAFFETAVEGAARRGQLMMLALQIDGRAVAMKCNFLSGEGGFAFKIAFDESFARCAPGRLLEVENIRRLHARREVRWFDSCAAPENRMFRELWIDRRTIETVLVSAGSEAGRLLVSTVPLAQWAKRAGRAAIKRVRQSWTSGAFSTG